MAELFFGDFRFDTRRLALEGPDGPVEVRAKTLQALTHLITHRNRFVSRAELMEELWPDVAVTGASITQCISELRGALDDSARSPIYIETRVKYGYRFIATLYHRPTERLEPLPPPPQMINEIHPPKTSTKRRIILIAGILLVTVLILGAWTASRWRPTPRTIVSISSVATSTSLEGTGAMADAIRRELIRNLELRGNITVTAQGHQDQANLTTEISTRGTPAGRLEVVAIVRSQPEGRELWGWTWVEPMNDIDLDRTAGDIAERIATALAQIHP
jgi:DNA-binding winged helix-turn-helix (wHTH) protein